MQAVVELCCGLFITGLDHSASILLAFPILIPLVSTSPILLYFLKVQSFGWSHTICSLFLCFVPLITAFDSDMRRGVSLLLCLLPYPWPLGGNVWSPRPT